MRVPNRVRKLAWSARGAVDAALLAADIIPERTKGLPGMIHQSVVLITPGMDIVNGGIMSISDIATLTAPMVSGEVIVATMPGEASIAGYSNFDCPHTLHPFAAVLPRLDTRGYHLIHVPELYVGGLAKWLTRRAVRHLRYNILLQNIDRCPARAEVDVLRRLGPVSCSTAHERYTNDEVSERLGLPLHYLATPAGPRFHKRVSLPEKSPLTILSPDAHAERDTVVTALHATLPDHELRTIKGMTYRQFLRSIEQARYAFTFGEGLDDYFVKSIFSGAVAFAVDNGRFFPESLAGCPGIFATWNEVHEKLPSILRDLDDPSRFGDWQERQFRAVAAIYDGDSYVARLQALYDRYHPALTGADKR